MFVGINQDALDFFLYESLGVTATDSLQLIEDKCIEKAYFDATMMGAFNTSLTDQTRRPAKEAKTEGARYLREMLQAAREASSRDEYDKWHHESCFHLRALYHQHELNTFTYGNAQKWVNMTMKYLYLLRCLLNRQELGYIDEITPYLHVPIDSYIIEAVWDDSDIPLPTLEDKLLKDGSRGAYSSGKVVGWSSWEPDSEGGICRCYTRFQQAIRDRSIHDGAASAIEWEESIWIAQAKSRRGGLSTFAS